MAVRPVKTQISLGIHPVRSESSLSPRRKLRSLATNFKSTQRRLIRLGGCQADLSFCWAHTHFVAFDMRRLICYFVGLWSFEVPTLTKMSSITVCNQNAPSEVQYSNDPKFSDRYQGLNKQCRPRSDNSSNFRIITAFFVVSENLGSYGSMNCK